MTLFEPPCRNAQAPHPIVDRHRNRSFHRRVCREVNVSDFITRPWAPSLTLAHLESKLSVQPTRLASSISCHARIYTASMIAFLGRVVLYIFGSFRSPALYKNERRRRSPAFCSPPFFLLLQGIAFGYYITLPYCSNSSFIPETLACPASFHDSPSTKISISRCGVVGLGLYFENFRSVLFLTLFGIVTPNSLEKFRYAIAIIARCRAIITPTPELHDMLIFMAPMLGAYLVVWALGAGDSSKHTKLARESAVLGGKA